MRLTSRNFLIVSLFLALVSCNKPKTLYDALVTLPGVVSVDSICLDSTFMQQYEIYFEQLIDHENPEFGTFNQRVILSHADTSRPMIAILEGYKIWSGTAFELTKMFRGNQLNIEHRFFNKSRPDSIPWDKLTIWQAATDQHKIIQALQSIYKQSWITTGISKGGQTTMYHETYYPDDAEAGVVYVAPLNYEREDPRINYFLEEVGEDVERQRIYDFQIICFENFDALLEKLKVSSQKNDWTFKFGYKKALEYTILEYAFAYWQWGSFEMEDIPENNPTIDEIFDHLKAVSSFTFFEDKSVEENRPFFWAALTQIGMYAYDVTPFKKYLGDTTNYTFDFTAPKGTNPQYDYDAMMEVKEHLDTKGEQMMYIYGGLDPWNGTAYDPPKNLNAVRIRLRKGHHDTRIRHIERKYRKFLYKRLHEWTGFEPIEIYEYDKYETAN